MKVGLFVTNQNPLGSDPVAALENQYVMVRQARDTGWDAIATPSLRKCWSAFSE